MRTVAALLQLAWHGSGRYATPCQLNRLRPSGARHPPRRGVPRSPPTPAWQRSGRPTLEQGPAGRSGPRQAPSRSSEPRADAHHAGTRSRRRRRGPGCAGVPPGRPGGSPGDRDAGPRGGHGGRRPASRSDDRALEEERSIRPSRIGSPNVDPPDPASSVVPAGSPPTSSIRIRSVSAKPSVVAFLQKSTRTGRPWGPATPCRVHATPSRSTRASSAAPSASRQAARASSDAFC